jgi:hypothetical protein
MWQSPSSRTRAAQAMRKKERDRLKPHLRLQKVRAEVKVLGKAVEPQFADCQVVLNDFNPLGVALFSSSPLMVGDEVALTLEEPKQFYIKGRIVSCQEYDATSKVISQNTFSYRIGIQFKFETEEEKAEVKAYCDQIAQESLFGRKVA